MKPEGVLFLSFLGIVIILMIIVNIESKKRLKEENEEKEKKRLFEEEREKKRIKEELSKFDNIKEEYLNKELIFTELFMNWWYELSSNTKSLETKVKTYALIWHSRKINKNFKLKCVDIYLSDENIKHGIENSVMMDFIIDDEIINIDFFRFNNLLNNEIFKIEDYQKLCEEFGEDNIIKSLNGNFSINSTKKEVEIAIGKPNNIIKKVNNDYYEKYTYDFKELNVVNENEYSIKSTSPYRSKSVKLFFKNNKLEYIEEY